MSDAPQPTSLMEQPIVRVGGPLLLIVIALVVLVAVIDTLVGLLAWILPIGGVILLGWSYARRDAEAGPPPS